MIANPASCQGSCLRSAFTLCHGGQPGKLVALLFSLSVSYNNSITIFTLQIMIKSLLIFGAIQGFVFAIALLSIRTPKSALTNRLFSLLIFSVSLFLLISSQAMHFSKYPKYFLASYVLIYLYCPLYNLFTQTLVNPMFTFSRSHLLHALPASLYLVALGRYFFMNNSEIMQRLATGDYLDLTSMDIISISMNIFFVWKSWELMRANNNLSIPYAREWPFAFLSLSLLISNLAWLYLIIPQLGFSGYVPPFGLNSVYFAMSALIFVFGYILIIRAEHFSVRTIVQNIRYRNVNMDETLVRSLEQRINEAFESNKPFKNPTFSLQDLADLCQLDKFKISYTINNSMKTNFTGMVNRYRVEEFIQLVNSKGFSNFSMLGIAMEAGFSSKSTFYKAFKEIKGMTPKEYFKDDPDSGRQIA